MPGLVPGIFLGTAAAAEMDARNKSGHDGGGRSGMTKSLSKEGRQGMMEEGDMNAGSTAA